MFGSYQLKLCSYQLMLLCYQLMLLERSFVISHNLYIVEWVYIVLKRYTHKYRLLTWNLSIEKHYQSWLYLWNCCNKSDVALFSVSTQSIKYKVKSLYRYMLKSVFFQVPGGKACNEFLFLNLVSVYFKLIKEWEKTRGAGHFWRFKFWSTLVGNHLRACRQDYLQIDYVWEVYSCLLGSSQSFQFANC